MIVISSVSLAFGSIASKWSNVASNHILFAKALADRDAKFDEKLLRIAQQYVSECQLSDAGRSELNAGILADIELFIADYCEPWFSTWAEALRPCHARRAPGWCSDKKAAQKRLSPGAYYEHMRIGIREASSSLERFNLARQSRNQTIQEESSP